MRSDASRSGDLSGGDRCHSKVLRGGFLTFTVFFARGEMWGLWFLD